VTAGIEDDNARPASQSNPHERFRIPDPHEGKPQLRQPLLHDFGRTLIVRRKEDRAS
jgi:hypothetical protein